MSKLNADETQEILDHIDEALQWYEIKGPRPWTWEQVSKSVQEGMSRSEFLTIPNPFGTS
jgi:hypothetical protein